MATLVESIKAKIEKLIYKELFPGVPEPTEEVESLYRTVSALKIGYEQLTRGRGDRCKSALLVCELDAIVAGILSEVETEVVEGELPASGDHDSLTNVTPNQHHNKSHAHDGTDGSGLVDYDDLLNKPPGGGGSSDHDDLTNVTPNQHHNKSHAHDGTDGSGSVAHGNLTGITANQHHNQAHLLYGPDQTDVNTDVTLEDGHVLAAEQSITSQFHPEFRVKWHEAYAYGPVYNEMTMVNEFGLPYISISNKQTAEYAFPTEVGPLEAIYPDSPPFLEDSDISQVRSGYNVVFTEDGEVRSLEVWIPEVTADTHYSLVAINDPNGSPSTTRHNLANGDLVVGQWNTVVLGSQLYLVGQEVLVYLESHNYAGTSQVAGDWTYTGTSQSTNPAAQGWNVSNQSTTLRIDKTDLASAARTLDLLGIISGSLIKFVETAAPKNEVVYRATSNAVEDGTAITWNVALESSAGSILVNSATSMTAEVPIAAATKFVYETNKFGTQPAFATITSFLQYDDADQAVPPTTGYGINFDFQQLDQSDDWDLIALGTGGGGGGSSIGDLPPGGTTGQRLVKVSNADYDTDWGDTSSKWSVIDNFPDPDYIYSNNTDGRVGINVHDPVNDWPDVTMFVQGRPQGLFGTDRVLSISSGEDVPGSGRTAEIYFDLSATYSTAAIYSPGTIGYFSGYKQYFSIRNPATGGRVDGITMTSNYVDPMLDADLRTRTVLGGGASGNPGIAWPTGVNVLIGSDKGRDPGAQGANAGWDEPSIIAVTTTRNTADTAYHEGILGYISPDDVLSMAVETGYDPNTETYFVRNKGNDITGTEVVSIDNAGDMTLTALAGTGDRSIGVDASGKLIEVASYGRWDNSADTVFNATPVVIDFDTASISQNISPYLTFDSVAHTWTVVVDCIIQVQTCITINTTGVLTARQTSEVGLYIDGVILPYAKAYAYHRTTTDGIGTVSISAIVAVSAGEVIDFRARYIDGTVALKAELNSSVSMNLLK